MSDSIYFQKQQVSWLAGRLMSPFSIKIGNIKEQVNNICTMRSLINYIHKIQNYITMSNKNMKLYRMLNILCEFCIHCKGKNLLR